MSARVGEGPESLNWYAAHVCDVIAHGGKRFTPERTGWGDYLARWIWLRDRAAGSLRSPGGAP